MRCPICSYDFPLLDEAQQCSKCQARKPGMSATELEAINKKPQCASCGIISNLLQLPVCNTCIESLRRRENIPRDILKLPNVASKLFGNNEESSQNQCGNNLAGLSQAASSIINIAAEHQRNASSSRLGKLVQVQNKGLAKINAMRAERNQKTKEHYSKDTGIQITAAIWVHGAKRLGAKMRQMDQSCVTGVFAPDEVIKNALETLLSRILVILAGKHGGKGPKLTWQDIELHSHYNATTHSSIDYFDKTQSVAKLLQLFQDNRLVSEAKIAAKSIEVRLVCNHSDITLELDDDLEPNYVSSTVSSKRKRPTNSQTPVVSKKKSLGSVVSAPSERVLHSAFRAPAQSRHWSRKPPLVKFTFTHTRAICHPDGNVVLVAVDDEREEIEIASNWTDVEKLNESNPSARHATESGYIGAGFTKRGIYARFNGHEYVLTQVSDPDSTDVEAVLYAEYKLLCQCNYFKEKFDEYATSNRVEVADFYFNFNHSILGRLESRTTSDGTPHQEKRRTLFSSDYMYIDRI